MERPPPRSSSTSPPTEAAVEGAGNEEPNEAERIGGLPPRRWRESPAPMLDGDLGQSALSRFPGNLSRRSRGISQP